MQPNDIRSKVIVALDVADRDAALKIVDELHGKVGAFKVGLQLFTAAGPSFVRKLADRGEDVFLDLKFHDIPNTVSSASVSAAELGVWMLNVHAAGGSEMMRRTARTVRSACAEAGLRSPLLIGVTVLTSSDRSTLSEVGVESSTAEQVVRLAVLTKNAGFDGVVASAQEAAAIRAACGDDLLIVTPGIRPKDATFDDQKRVMTLGGAIAAGSSYVVVGRPIIAASDRVAALESLIYEANGRN